MPVAPRCWAGVHVRAVLKISHGEEHAARVFCMATLRKYESWARFLESGEEGRDARIGTCVRLFRLRRRLRKDEVAAAMAERRESGEQGENATEGSEAAVVAHRAARHDRRAAAIHAMLEKINVFWGMRSLIALKHGFEHCFGPACNE